MRGGGVSIWRNTYEIGQISESRAAHQAADGGKRGRDNGLVTVNGKPARASYEVKVGDHISMRFGARTVTVEVLSVQETVKQADAAALYREIREE